MEGEKNKAKEIKQQEKINVINKSMEKKNSEETCRRFVFIDDFIVFQTMLATGSVYDVQAAQ